VEPAEQNQKDDQKQETNQQKLKNYSKRPLWQWMLIYLVVAVVVYFLVYLIFFRGDSNTGLY
jgi:uncharacterized membrane protein